MFLLADEENVGPAHAGAVPSICVVLRQELDRQKGPRIVGSQHDVNGVEEKSRK